MAYDPSTTAILLVDSYNDFLSEEGKVWPLAKAVAEEVHLLDNLRSVIASARAGGFKIVFVPHHRAEPGDIADWLHATPYQQQISHHQTFRKGKLGRHLPRRFPASAG